MLTTNAVLQNRYQIVRLIAHGGMGAVYQAVDQRLGNTVAIKETLFTDEMLRKAFQREARLLAGLNHPALPVVHDHFTEGDGQFLVMQFISGHDLEESVKHKGAPFSADRVLEWVDQLLDALDYLHTQSPPIIHRDIKPQNLKVTNRGNIILLDFGLAKGSAAGMSRISSGGSIFGYTPNYAPLEQMQGAGTDPRSDLYSLGATLYYLMTGLTPPDAITRATAHVSKQSDPLRAAHELNSEIPPPISYILLKAMAQNRDYRYSSADEMRKALQLERQRSNTASKKDDWPLTILDVIPTQAPTTVAQKVNLTEAAAMVGHTTATGAGQAETVIERPAGSPPSARRGKSLAVIVPLILAIFITATIIVYKRNARQKFMAEQQRLETLYRGALTGDSKSAPYHNALASALFLQGKYAEAEAEVRTAIAIRQDTDNYALFGDILFAQGRYAEAEVEYRNAIGGYGDKERAEQGLQSTLKKLGKTQ